MVTNASDIASRMIQPTGTAPCAGCGAVVETATVLGRMVYACDECANVRCSWCGKSRKPSAYAGDFEFPGLVNICQWCRARETRNARGKAKPKPGEWVDRVYPLELDP